ncbi:hypothetical protein ATC00_28440 [Sinorhizobium americanum]|nr:hypothetical protein ATC00_28440 [Sinorhizobium americanum]
MLLTLEKIETAGAGFRSLTEAIDTTTPEGTHDDADARLVHRIRAPSCGNAQWRVYRQLANAGERVDAVRNQPPISGNRPIVTAEISP